MAIQAISPYRMPAHDDLPANRVAWHIDRRRVVLLVHDMQEYFLAPFASHEPPARDLVHNIHLLRRQCDALTIPVVYTAQPGGMTDEQRGLLKDFWGPGMRADPEHRRVVPSLAPAAHDRVFTKWRYSAFFRTPLLEFLHDSRRDQLMICGVYAHVGCLMTACDAFANDIQPFLISDAVADFSLDYHRMALTYAAERCAVIATTAMAFDALAGRATAAPARRAR
jgi:isochorismate hydrolase